MVLDFLFWLFLVGIIVASFQDLKRREIDNWLNLFLIFSSFTYLFFTYFVSQDLVYLIVAIVFASLTSFLFFYNGDMFSGIESSKKKYYFWLSVVCLIFISIILFAVNFFGLNEIPFFIIVALAFLVMFVVSNLFYEGRVFAGGDARLLFAMTLLFVSYSFNLTLVNMGIFVFLLMFSGSIYGLVYSFVLYFKDFKKVNKEIKKGFSNMWICCMILIGIFLIFFSFFNFLFLILGILVLFLSLLYVFSKGLESVFMIRVVTGKELREGDWLVDDIKVGKKTIEANWDGLSLSEIDLLKSKKKVKIKSGLPFAPAFLIAFLIYVFLKDYLLSFFFMGF